jgi:metallophosphoesterase superfamily enzyme
MKVLAIGDLHAPFTLKKYLRFCKNVDRRCGCNQVVFIGDLVDNHYSSFHETDPDGYSAGEELDRAITEIRKWYLAFPEAYVCIGNHDRIVHRKAYSAGISRRWVRDYGEMFDAPGWKFVEDVIIDNVRYCHGEGKKAPQKAKDNMRSYVQGHHHSESGVVWHTGDNCRVFGMQVGNGIDRKSYAMAYGKHGPHPAISCGVIEHGKVATNYLMDL